MIADLQTALEGFVALFVTANCHLQDALVMLNTENQTTHVGSCTENVE